jgi:hypothetical protein
MQTFDDMFDLDDEMLDSGAHFRLLPNGVIEAVSSGNAGPTPNGTRKSFQPTIGES